MACTSGATGEYQSDSRARLAGNARHAESGRTTSRACLARRARRALERLANLFSILLMFQFVSHNAQQMRHAKGLLEGLPCPEEVRDIHDILFLSGT
jgi:hypothetical protein